MHPTTQTEKEIIARYGLPRDEMIAFRRSQLKEGEDWYRVSQGAKPAHMCPIAFTDGGYLKLLAKFKLTTTEQDVWPKVAIVSRTNWPNQKLMTVLIDGKSHNVVVANAKLFYPGAEVEVDRRGGNLICSQRPLSPAKLFQALKRKHEEIHPRKEIR
jgi:hypothetical protein